MLSKNCSLKILTLETVSLLFPPPAAPVKAKLYCKGRYSVKEIPSLSCTTILHKICSAPLWGKKKILFWEYFSFKIMFAVVCVALTIWWFLKHQKSVGQLHRLSWWQRSLISLKFIVSYITVVNKNWHGRIMLDDCRQLQL